MRIRVKICGLVDSASVDAAVQAGADALGFVLDPSPRQLTVDQARSLIRHVPTDVDTVAVVGRPDADTLERYREQIAPKWIQLMADAVPPGSHGFRLIPAFEDGPDLRERVDRYRAASGQQNPLVLADGPKPGSGIQADWDRVAALTDAVRVIVAGGLNPDNVGDAIRRLRPYGVDVSSGVESSRGVKDPERIRAFLAAVRAAELDIGDTP